MEQREVLQCPESDSGTLYVAGHYEDAAPSANRVAWKVSSASDGPPGRDLPHFAGLRPWLAPESSRCGVHCDAGVEPNPRTTAPAS